MNQDIFKTDSFSIKTDNAFPITVLLDKNDESPFKEGSDYKVFEGIEEYRKIRNIVDLSISKMSMKEEKGIFNKDGSQKYSKNFLDIEHIIYP